jgi:SRSO17 transposase
MNLPVSSQAREARFAAYVEALAEGLGHGDRIAPMRAYCTGLLLPGERKSIEPMAARIEPDRVQAAHQSLHHLIASADWSDEAVLAIVREQVLPEIERHGAIRTWIVDDTSFPKKGSHSVGVARQYCGQLGKQENCQVAVSLSVANAHASLPIAYQLYLPEAWAQDPERRIKAGVPDPIPFRTKPRIALAQIRAALVAGVSPAVVLADAGYGGETAFRTALTKMGLTYIVGIPSTTSVWAPGTAPLPPQPWRGRGRPPSLLRRDSKHKPVSAKKLAKDLPDDAWRIVTWREGSKGPLTSRFAAVRVRPAHRDYWRAALRAEEWCLIEWPEGEKQPTKYWLSTLSKDTALTELVDLTKLRWRIERDYQELKQEIGLGHYEGRGWRGFHHHATLCIAAYGFLVSERNRFPPSDRFRPTIRTALPLFKGDYPRGSAHPPGAPRRAFDRYHPG